MDLILSVVGIILFIALVIIIVLRFSPSNEPSYGDPFLANLPFLDGSRVANSDIISATQSDILGDRYDTVGHTACVLISDGSGQLPGSGTTGCKATAPIGGFCDGQVLAHYRKPVFVDYGAYPEDNRFGELNVVICRD
jgi:hypothetical protein